MKITFNSINAVTGVITNDEALRQGNVGANTLTAVFEGKSNLAYTATFNYTRSDDGRLKDIPMTPTANAGEYYYKFSNPWFFAVYGETTLTVYLKNASNEIVASGQITFPIEQTDFDDDPNITYSEYQVLLDSLAIMQIEYEPHNVRGYDTLVSAESDLSQLAFGQLIIVKTNPVKIYQVQENEEFELYLAPLDSVGAYLPLAGGTMSGAIVQPVAPVENEDLANKKYVDDSVKVATDDIADILDGDLTVHTSYHAEMDVYGNVIPTYYQPKLTFDNTPTTGSANPVKSSGIKNYVDGKVAEIDGGVSDFSIIINAAIDSVLSKTFYQHSGAYSPIYILKRGSNALIIKSTAINLYQGTQGGTWTLSKTLSVESETGYSLALNPTTYVLTLRNKAGGLLSSVDLPLESVVVSGSYDDLTQSIILTLQNGTEITIPVADLVDGLVPNTRTIAGIDLADDITASELKTALSLVKADVGLGNVINPNEYNNIGVSTDLDTITISGTYTCYGTANGVPSADYSWFILHLNSGVGTAYAKQIAFAYDGKIYVRFKSTTWGAWAFIPASTLGFDNTIKNILVATNLQEAIDEVSEKVSDITATYTKMISGTTFAGYVASPSISHSGYYVINDDTSLIYLKGSLYSLTSAGVVTLISSTSESWYGSQEEYDDIAVKNPNTMYYIEEA